MTAAALGRHCIRARDGRRHAEPFADELVRYANAPRELIAALLKAGWPPADVYYACTLASVAGQSCRALAQARGAQPGEPWAVTAARVGIPADAAVLQQVRCAAGGELSAVGAAGVTGGAARIKRRQTTGQGSAAGAALVGRPC